jgi:hypothetical protein
MVVHDGCVQRASQDGAASGYKNSTTRGGKPSYLLFHVPCQEIQLFIAYTD